MGKKRAPGPKVTELITTEQLAEEATWQHKLRAAAFNGISEQDVTEIVQNAVQRAKEGDPKAVNFVMKMLGADRPITVNNHLYVDGEKRDPKPTEAVPGSEEKLEEMRRRVTNGERVFDGRDRIGYEGVER